MATPKRTRATSTTTRSKKASASVENTTLPQSHGNVEDLIRFRAYQLFEQRGRNHGSDLEDWLRAEVEVTRAKAHSA